MPKRTPLNASHKKLGARMVEFGGWEMPVQYRGLIEEHLAVRQAAGLFDVSHMGEIEILGAGALAFIQELTINDASRLVDGQVQYSALCYPHGGVVDDVTLYRFSSERYLFCVNAANTQKDFTWMKKALEEGGFREVALHDRSGDFAQLALQGPAATQILSRLTDADLTEIATYHFREGAVANVLTMISRTGYTGEEGFELYLPPSRAEEVWDALLDAGRAFGLMPAGLGARDTLRLEMKYPLYGHELEADITPLEAGLGWITRLEKPSFIGRAALARMKQEGVLRKLAPFVMTGAGIPRAGYPLFAGGEKVGYVTSGTLSPSLRVGIGLGLIQAEYAVVGAPLQVEIRGRRVDAQVIKPPFVKT